MSRFTQFVGAGTRAVLGAAGSFLLWTLWLGLAVLLVVQLYILTANELAIPDFVLRQVEAKLAEAGLRATFGRTSFDPTGRVLVYDAQLWLPGLGEPVVTAGTVYVHVNPLALVIGKFEPTEVRVMEAAATIPAPLTRSGQPEAIIRDVDATIEPAARLLTIRQLNAQVAGIVVTAHGSVPLQPRTTPTDRAAVAEFIAQRLPAYYRQASNLAAQLTAVESPSIELELGPSESGALTINVRALARAVTLPEPYAGTARNIRIATRVLLFGDRPPSRIEVSADEVQLGLAAAKVRALNAVVHGQFRTGSVQFDLRDVAATADAVTAAGATVQGVSALVYPRGLPRLQATIVTRALGEPLALQGEADLGQKTATVKFNGAISPTVLDLISEHVHVNVRKYYDFDSLALDAAEAHFGENWKFEKLTARVRIPRMNSYGVIMEDGRATVELEPHRFYSPDAYARVGQNFARGTYEHDLRTHRYRFLLEGRLRPMELSPWFHEWWPDFFKQIEFVEAPPAATVDVGGSWRDGAHSSVFVFCDAGKTVVRGTPFDRVRTRLFIRPAFFDGLEILAARAAADAHGRFTLVAHPETHDWQSLDLSLDSTLDLKIAEGLLGEAGTRAFAPFELATPPQVTVRGTFAGPAAPAGAKDALHIQAKTTGEFRFHHFPLQDASFLATLDGDDIVLDKFEARFGGGTASGHARVWGAGAGRRLGFDLSLQDATLGQVTGRLTEFFAAEKGTAAAPPGKFAQEKANVRLDVAASAEGLYSDPLSFHGDGNVALRGAEIGEVPLLGSLSELLKFTALRFTEARSNFKIEGAKLVFRQVELRGANSAIDAHGEYALDKRSLDFNAKVFPFHESGSLIKSVVGAVLTPLSNALEVKLTGSLEKPEWAFVMGPTNFLRNLGEGGSDPAAGKPATDQSPAPAPQTASEKP